MDCLGRRGDIWEVRRREGEVCLEWEIPRFLDLKCGEWDWYESPSFPLAGALWNLRVRPHCDGRVALSLWRDGSGPSALTANVSAGVKGSGERREVEREFGKDEGYWLCAPCKRGELAERGLLPGGAMTVTCHVRATGTGDSSNNPVASVQSRGEYRQQNAPTAGSPASDKQDSSTQTQNNFLQEEKQGEVLVIYSFKELQEATQNFCDRFKIGEGGFGTVYRAVIWGDDVAVKKLKDPKDEQFVVELKTLTNYRHDNLVPLLGVALGTSCCLVYEYMPNGSLEDRLACKNETEPLSWRTRLSISYGSALGINHLHTFAEKPEVHRDIKSANILLDRNWVPKVGDFGLVRTGDSGGSTTNPVTRTCTGTPGYMPREALVGDVSVKWDTYSFGVVLLELLTGLPPFDPNRRHRYLIPHMEHCKDIISRVDPKAKWSKAAATELCRIAQRCLAESKRSRPTISEILESLRKLSLLH